MSFDLRRCVGALVAAGALAVPSVAGAADVSTAVSAVRTHTDRADVALDRAVANFANGRDAQGRRAFARSRNQMGLAVAAAAKALREAETPQERRDAARALAALAAEQDDNVERLVGSLAAAEGRTEKPIAAAARTDTRGREKAIGVLTALLGQVPEQARDGIVKAIASLSQDRDEEIVVAARALRSHRVSRRSKRRVADAVQSSVDGQAKAGEIVCALAASEQMPAPSRTGLQRACDAMIAEHGRIADVLSRFSARMPSFVRSFVEEVVTQARQDAQGMRENRPAPPAETQSQRPDSTPTGGPPDSTSAGPPAGAPAA